MLALTVCAVGAHATDCQELLARHVRADVDLPFDAFDQDEHPGWRALGSAGCESEAADLVAAYAARHAHPVLAWHRAQLLAEAGRTDEAVQAMRGTLRAQGSDLESGFDWNDYAEASIAFLQGDRRGLQIDRDRLALTSRQMEFNLPNLHAVDNLLRCFGRPYKVAYACPTTP